MKRLHLPRFRLMQSHPAPHQRLRLEHVPPPRMSYLQCKSGMCLVIPCVLESPFDTLGHPFSPQPLKRAPPAVRAVGSEDPLQAAPPSEEDGGPSGRSTREAESTKDVPQADCDVTRSSALLIALHERNPSSNEHGDENVRHSIGHVT